MKFSLLDALEVVVVTNDVIPRPNAVRTTSPIHYSQRMSGGGNISGRWVNTKTRAHVCIPCPGCLHIFINKLWHSVSEQCTPQTESHSLWWAAAIRQATIWTNDCWLLIRSHGNKFNWNLHQNTMIFIQENYFWNVVCKMAIILFRLRCVQSIPVCTTWSTSLIR